MHTFFLPIRLGQPTNRLQPDGLMPYAKPCEWEEFCDKYDRLALDPFLRYGPFFMRLSLVIALAGLVTAAVLGVTKEDDDEEDSEEQEKTVSTGAIVGFAFLISFPFKLAASHLHSMLLDFSITYSKSKCNSQIQMHFYSM